MSKGILPSSFNTRRKNRGVLYSSWVDRWGLVGNGEVYSDCGKWSYRGCLETEDHHSKIAKVNGEIKFLEGGKAFIKKFQKSCFRAECPVCYEDWISRRTGEIKKVLDHRRDMKGKSSKVIHIILSPPNGDSLGFDWVKEVVSMAREFSYVNLRRELYDICHRVGLNGGVVIFHPKRRECGCCGGKIPHKADKCPECGFEQFKWYFSPHFHILGFGWVVDGDKIEEIYDKTGWVVVNKGVRRSVGGSVYYLLSHSGFSDRWKTITYFGDCKDADFWLSDVGCNSENIEKCPYCGRVLEPVRRKDGVDPFDDGEGSYFVRGDRWEYADVLVVFGGVPKEFVDDPVNDGCVNWGSLLIRGRG